MVLGIRATPSEIFFVEVSKNGDEYEWHNSGEEFKWPIPNSEDFPKQLLEISKEMKRRLDQKDFSLVAIKISEGQTFDEGTRKRTSIDAVLAMEAARAGKAVETLKRTKLTFKGEAKASSSTYCDTALKYFDKPDKYWCAPLAEALLAGRVSCA